MKKNFIYLVVVLSFISCGLNREKKITQAEFKQLLMSDSIAEIQICNDHPAKIYIKSFHKNNEPCFLKIESQESFKDSLETYIKTLSIKNIHPRFSYSYSTGESKIIMGGLPLILILGQIIILVSIILLFLYAIKDILNSKFEFDNDKLIWVLLVILVPIIGPFLYISTGKKQKLLK
jgi:ATP-dependent Zn protease